MTLSPICVFLGLSGLHFFLTNIPALRHALSNVLSIYLLVNNVATKLALLKLVVL